MKSRAAARGADSSAEVLTEPDPGFGSDSAPSAPTRPQHEADVSDDEVASLFADFEATGPSAPAAGDETRRMIVARPSERNLKKLFQVLVRTLVGKRAAAAEAAGGGGPGSGPGTAKRDLDLVLEIVKNRVLEAVNAEALAVYFLEPDAIRVRQVYFAPSAQGEREAECRATARKLSGLALRRDQGIVGRAIEQNRARFTLDASRAPEHDDALERQGGYAIRTMLTVPIVCEGEVYGALEAWNKDRSHAAGPEFFSQRDLAVVEEIAEYSARLLYLARNPGRRFTPDDVARFVARLAGRAYVDLAAADLDRETGATVGAKNLRAFRIVPLARVGAAGVKVAIDDPLDVQRRDSFQVASGLEIVEVEVAASSTIDAALEALVTGAPWPPASAGALGGDLHRAVELTAAGDKFVTELKERTERDRALLSGDKKGGTEVAALSETDAVDSAPVIQLVNRLVEGAVARGASDIHIEPFESQIIVRYRIDGVLQEALRLQGRGSIRPLAARIKVMAALNVSESRLPQYGRIDFKEFSKAGVDVDLRVSTCPVAWGEKVVLRLLLKQASLVGVEGLGFSPWNLDRYKRCLAAPHGMILHTGPTGSGKTTTLYAALQTVATPELNVQTAEDPIEVLIPGVNQLQMKPKIGLTFAAALRAFLRQDPDVILVGEIRDRETAQIAVEAALTGHLLLSTLHTNNAPGAITRLIELDIEPFLVASSLVSICAQRLVRVLCTCKEEREPGPAESELLGLQDEDADTIFAPRRGGCQRCHGTGNKGRTGVHELCVLDDELRALASRRGTTTGELTRAAREGGMVPLLDDGLAKVRAGFTSLEEVRALG